MDLAIGSEDVEFGPVLGRGAEERVEGPAFISLVDREGGGCAQRFGTDLFKRSCGRLMVEPAYQARASFFAFIDVVVSSAL